MEKFCCRSCTFITFRRICLGKSRKVITDDQHILETTLALIQMEKINGNQLKRVSSLNWNHGSPFCYVWLLAHHTSAPLSNILCNIFGHICPVEPLLCQIDNTFCTQMCHILMQFCIHQLMVFCGRTI